mmetsp:Transcript_1184/g.2567  ORF Transcript_1184/g.2567 Transcript_1184/m.2567 type:complete len:216 (-) Transcript_1184:1843-2490(-)
MSVSAVAGSDIESDFLLENRLHEDLGFESSDSGSFSSSTLSSLTPPFSTSFSLASFVSLGGNSDIDSDFLLEKRPHEDLGFGSSGLGSLSFVASAMGFSSGVLLASFPSVDFASSEPTFVSLVGDSDVDSDFLLEKRPQEDLGFASPGSVFRSSTTTDFSSSTVPSVHSSAAFLSSATEDAVDSDRLLENRLQDDLTTAGFSSSTCFSASSFWVS